jgi:malonyl-CoA O-methyltransferase
MTDLFDLDKAKVKASFSSAASTYDGLAILQRKAADHLLQNYIGTDVDGKVVDLGCGTGCLTSHLIRQNSVQSMVALDIAFSMLQVARCRLASDKNLHYVCADAEALPMQAETIDWVVSNLALQWCRDIISVFNQVRRALKPGGKLVFSTFGPQTLQELKLAWDAVDQFTHINQFYSQQFLHQVLLETGFGNIKYESRSYLSSYKNVFELMRELKGIGAHNVTSGRNRAMTGKGKFNKMVDAYELSGEAGRLNATFEIMYFTAERI